MYDVREVCSKIIQTKHKPISLHHTHLKTTKRNISVGGKQIWSGFFCFLFFFFRFCGNMQTYGILGTTSEKRYCHFPDCQYGKQWCMQVGPFNFHVSTATSWHEIWFQHSCFLSMNCINCGVPLPIGLVPSSGQIELLQLVTGSPYPLDSLPFSALSHQICFSGLTSRFSEIIIINVVASFHRCIE